MLPRVRTAALYFVLGFPTILGLGRLMGREESLASAAAFAAFLSVLAVVLPQRPRVS